VGVVRESLPCRRCSFSSEMSCWSSASQWYRYCVLEQEGLVAEARAGVTGGGADSLGALALSLCFFLVVKTLKMSCENSCSCSSSKLAASLTCRMCDSMISSI
jgi:hypothetical protein